MTREAMNKRSFKPYQEILYRHKRMIEPVLMMLVAIDFDNETMTLSPIDKDFFEDDDYVTSIDFCEIPVRGLKMKVI